MSFEAFAEDEDKRQNKMQCSRRQIGFGSGV